MIPVNPMVFLICLFLLSRVGESWAQSDSCSYQGEQVTGEFTIPGICLLYRCIPGQGVTAIGCGIRIPPDGCYVEHPITKNFPECCYTRLVCAETDSLNNDLAYKFNATSREEFGGPKVNYGLPPAPFTATTSQNGYSTGRPQLMKTLTPPSPGGITPVFRPKSPQKKRPKDDFTEPQNIYDSPEEENLGSGPYYYKK